MSYRSSVSLSDKPQFKLRFLNLVGRGELGVFTHNGDTLDLG